MLARSASPTRSHVGDQVARRAQRWGGRKHVRRGVAKRELLAHKPRPHPGLLVGTFICFNPTDANHTLSGRYSASGNNIIDVALPENLELLRSRSAGQLRVKLATSHVI